jgi:hypothetical protein
MLATRRPRVMVIGVVRFVRFCAVRTLGVRVKRCAVVSGTMRSRPSRDCSPRVSLATWSACCRMMALNAARPWSPLHGYVPCITLFVGVRSTRRDIFVVGLRSWREHCHRLSALTLQTFVMHGATIA